MANLKFNVEKENFRITGLTERQVSKLIALIGTMSGDDPDIGLGLYSDLSEQALHEQGIAPYPAILLDTSGYPEEFAVLEFRE